MALTPLVNHWWNVTFYVTPRGLTTSTMSHDKLSLAIDFDFIDHRLLIRTSEGAIEHLALEARPVADFFAEFMERLRRCGAEVHIWTMPSEIANPVPFDQDFGAAEYDPLWVERFLQAVRQADRVLKNFRARFIGKASPVHFFWGSFDLAVTRFSGRTAPAPTGERPNIPNTVVAEAYSHEVSSCGFWPGNGGYGKPAFYVYAYPEPSAYGETGLTTPGAYYDRELGQFLLPYDAVRQSANPDGMLLSFLQETYEAAADQAHWDRAALERKAEDVSRP
jgi:hypothetical protein